MLKCMLLFPYMDARVYIFQASRLELSRLRLSRHVALAPAPVATGAAGPCHVRISGRDERG